MGISLSLYGICFIVWASCVVSAVVSQELRWHVIGGIVGNLLVSPLYVMMFNLSGPDDDLRVLSAILFLMMYFFASFACLTGGVRCIRRG
jgi:hypothetical protein